MGTKSRSAGACSTAVYWSLCLSQLLKSVAGANYVVGENFVTGALWTNDPGPSTTNMTLLEQYEGWAKTVKISVGDTLSFMYDDSHTVVLVPTQQMYDSCNYETYVDVTSPSPPTIYTVNDTQPLYFVCSIDQHCDEGQKVAITKISSATTSPTPAVGSLPPAPSNGGHSFWSVSRLRSCSTLGLCVLLPVLFIR